MKARPYHFFLPLLFILVFSCEQEGQQFHPIPTIQVMNGIQSGINLAAYLNGKEIPEFSFHTDTKFKIDIYNDSLFVFCTNNSQGYYAITIPNFHKQSVIIKVKASETVQFSFHESVGEIPVYIIGNFNDWNNSSHPMQYSDGQWKCDIVVK